MNDKTQKKYYLTSSIHTLDPNKKLNLSGLNLSLGRSVIISN